jgi:hypothetical protein
MKDTTGHDSIMFISFVLVQSMIGLLHDPIKLFSRLLFALVQVRIRRNIRHTVWSSTSAYRTLRKQFNQSFFLEYLTVSSIYSCFLSVLVRWMYDSWIPDPHCQALLRDNAMNAIHATESATKCADMIERLQMLTNRPQ